MVAGLAEAVQSWSGNNGIKRQISLRSKRKGRGGGGPKKYQGKGREKRGDWGGEKGRECLQARRIKAMGYQVMRSSKIQAESERLLANARSVQKVESSSTFL